MGEWASGYVVAYGEIMLFKSAATESIIIYGESQLLFHEVGTPIDVTLFVH